MDRLAAQALYFKIVFGVLGALTYAFVASVLSFKPETEPKDIITSMVRLPAAIPAALPLPDVNLPIFSPTVRVQEPIKIETLAVSCWDSSQGQTLNTSARYVRLTGRGCSENLKNDSWQVSNSSNGFSATVFAPGQRQLTTDYIPLAAGKNEIHFAVLDADGVRHEISLNVERQ